MATDDEYSETIHMIRENPVALLITLSDGCPSGRIEAAAAFAQLVAEVGKRYTGEDFQFLPFSFDTPEDGTNPALNTILTVSF